MDFESIHPAEPPFMPSLSQDFGFDDFDLNGDGYITREEFDHAGTS
jgi:hypothetical protein